MMRTVKNCFPYFFAAACTLFIGLAAATAFGQDQNKDKYSRPFCDQMSSNDGDHVSYRDLRETTIPATGTLSADGNRNGGIRVMGEDRGDVLVRACVQAWGKTDAEAKSLASQIRVDTSGTIRADGGDNEHWSVSYDIRVPRSSSLDLRAQNGGIAITDINGSIAFETMNGGVSLDRVGGTVKGQTVNGGIHLTLNGSGWNGTGLDVKTTNGGVLIQLPSNFAAHVEAGTVNGGFKSDFAGLEPPKSDDNNYRSRSKRISADINGGGPLVRATTTNGGVRIEELGN